MSDKLEKIYDPKLVEEKHYENWQKDGNFSGVIDPSKKPYTIVMPPPNVTGNLHMGHALDVTLPDILIRMKRMQGFSALWIPGTDHAAIATEVKVVEKMRAEEGLEKKDITREEFLERAWKWTNEYMSNIQNQQKKLGASCDWGRSAFTMDEVRSKAVKTAFVHLYKKDLIYRGERLINWCPTCLTSISDAEVEHEEKHGFMWTFEYPLTDGSGSISVSTTRPETIYGDTAVAVHPEDERYKDMIGKTLTLPLLGREIPIVADEYVDMEFGTGAVKITPAHDPNDFELGQRHGLELITVMNEDGTMNEIAEPVVGLDRFKARKKTIELFEEAGLLVETKEHENNIGTCYRCHTVVEPRISTQWFVKMEELAKPAIDVVNEKEVKIHPERFEKNYMNWLDNIKDWCISRQLWWGHRIPVWYCDDCEHHTVSDSTPSECEKCKSKKIHQDEDTLDTWFSSALWPFATLGWPEKTPDFEYFYPTNVLVTGHDILFFWVVRMIFSGLEYTGEKPFDDVLFHGLVLATDGRKMSKSLGNGIDPLEVIDEFGADALRFALASGNSPGNDMRYSSDRILAARNFSNKLWNAARFIFMNLEEGVETQLPTEFLIEDRWVLSKMNRMVREVTMNIENYEFGVAAAKLYDFTWDVFCDWYIEIAKTRLALGGETSQNVQSVLIFVMSTILKLLHPFMPFITEEIFLALPNSEGSLMKEKWPIYRGQLNFGEDEANFEKIMTAIRGIRNRRSEMNVPPSKKAKVMIETSETEIFEESKEFFLRLASASEVIIKEKIGESETQDAVSLVTSSARIFIPMDELIDKDKEIARLTREKEKEEEEIVFLEGKLSNEGFTANAPDKVIAKEKDKLSSAKEKLEKIIESLQSFH